MNKKPVSYLQTDKRWKNVRIPCNGGDMSVGGGGCGPTSAAMLIETLTGKQCLPPDALKWACDHGYVTSGQGTDYAYFKPHFNQYGIECEMLTWCKCLDPGSWVRYKVIEMLQQGYYFIALMNPKYVDPVDPSKNIPGTWTSRGHYVVVWWADNKIRINDPASTKDARVSGDPNTFFSEAKYFWWIDARAHNNGREDEDVDIKKLINEITPEQVFELADKLDGASLYKLHVKLEDYLAKQPLPTSWDAAGELREAMTLGITDGTRPMCSTPRYQTAIMVKRAVKKK